MYQLQALEAIIGQQHHFSFEALHLEQQKIEVAFLEVLYSERSIENIQLFVSQHARGLLHLLQQQHLEEAVNEPMVLVLQHLLDFLERHGRPFWDHELVVPVFKRQLLTLDIERLITEMAPLLATLSLPADLDSSLQEDMYELLYQDQLTYGQLFMLHDLLTALASVLGHPAWPEQASPRLTRDIFELLYLYNFNSMNMYELAITQLDQQMGDGLSYNLTRLGRLQAYYSRFVPVKGYAYQHHRPSLASLSADYLDIRMDNLRREVYPADTYLPVNHKLPTAFTQDKMGCFTRIMIDIEMVRGNNWKDIARFMSSHMVTVGRTGKEPSSDSIYNNMFSPSLKTVVGTLDIIAKMHNRAVIWKTALKNTGKPPQD